MIVGGLMAVVEGIAAIANDNILLRTPQFIYQFSTAGWGWIHLSLGALATFSGLALLSGVLWARLMAVTLAGLSMLANFTWLPYQPIWALVLILLDGFIIWGVCVSRDDPSY